MTTVRTALAAALATALPAPEWRVTGHGRSVDRVEVDQHLVMLTTERWSRPDVALSLVPVRLQLYVLTGITDPDRVEDDLDAALVTVLAAYSGKLQNVIKMADNVVSKIGISGYPTA